MGSSPTVDARQERRWPPKLLVGQDADYKKLVMVATIIDYPVVLHQTYSEPRCKRLSLDVSVNQHMYLYPDSGRPIDEVTSIASCSIFATVV